MAVNDISLTSGMRNNLLSLQKTSDLINTTQQRLSTGKKVNSPLDNPTNYFAAQTHLERASDLTARKDGMAEAVQMVKAAELRHQGYQFVDRVRKRCCILCGINQQRH